MAEQWFKNLGQGEADNYSQDNELKEFIDLFNPSNKQKENLKLKFFNNLFYF